MSPDLTRRHINCVLAVVLSAAGICAGCKPATITAPLSIALPRDPWKDALSKVEEDRGEAVGRDALVEAPQQLKHHADRRRFLAIQAADAKAHVDETAFDFADVARAIQRGELVEMSNLGEDYILYGVGYNAGDQAFAHYDRATRQDIPMGETEEALNEELRLALDAAEKSAADLRQLGIELRGVPRRNKARAVMLKEIAAARKSVASAKSRASLLKRFYDDPRRRQSMLAEYSLLSSLADDFKGESYEVGDPEARRRLKMRLLSFIRPEARDVLIEIAKAYKEKFDRPLPVSSLVRPVQYQRRLARTNPNAARGATPPHSTGFSFDLFYRYMSAAEQEFLMSLIADLEDQGRVEALRESRNNIHVYVFGTGKPPEEKLVANILASGRPGKALKTPARKRGQKSIARISSRR